MSCKVAIIVSRRQLTSSSATTTTQTQLYTHLRMVVDKVSPETDVKRIATRIPPIEDIVPEPILYEVFSYIFLVYT